MSSRAFHRHLIARREVRPHEFDRWEPGKTPYWADAEFLIALCAEEHRIGGYRNDRFVEDEKDVSCPECRKKIARAKLKARPADAPQLSLEADKTAKGGFRNNGGWKALIDREPVAILGFEEHFWRIYPFVARKNDDDAIEVVNTHGVLREDHSTGSRFDGGGYRLPSDALRYTTKEDALLACEGLRQQGVLKTPAEVLQTYHDVQAEGAAWAHERRQKLAERDERNANTLEALREILATETLSNFQREGLMNAIAVYEAKVNRTDEAV